MVYKGQNVIKEELEKLKKLEKLEKLEKKLEGKELIKKFSNRR